LQAFLTRWDYRIIELDGRRMTSRVDAHAELARAFGFPEPHGSSWDSWNDHFNDFVFDNDGLLHAVLWTEIETTARLAPATTAEVGWALLVASWDNRPGASPTQSASLPMEIFALATGTDFNRPEP
jgi:hypothetical protein